MSPTRRGELHPAVAELLASRRLGSLEASRHRFTVSREEALMRLREQERALESGELEWTVDLIRAANALSAQAQVRVSVEQHPGEGEEPVRVTRFDVVTPGVELRSLDLAGMLAGALEPDLGAPFDEPDTPEALRIHRFRMLMGRALNAALAHAPLALQLQTPGGGRRFERREQLIEGRDPYAQRKVMGCEGERRFVVELTEPRPGFSSRLGRWLRGRGERPQELARLWTERRLCERWPAEVDALILASAAKLVDEGLSLAPTLVGEPARLGDHARLGRVAREDPLAPPWLRASLWLARDGCLLVDLGPVLRAEHLDPEALGGWVDCPKLRLTADESSVVRDGNFELLVAWLHDYLARSDGEGRVRWPEQPEDLGPGPSSAGGKTLALAELAGDARHGRELIYVWRHQAKLVPAHARDRVAALSPSERAVLQAALPELRLVPLRALGEIEVDPADLTSLAAGSYEPLPLVKDSPLAQELEPGGPTTPGARTDLIDALRISVDAYVHRGRTAKAGFVVILAYERRVTQFHERARVVPGVTLICRVRSDEGTALDLAALRRDHVLLSRIAELCLRKTREHFEALLTHVMRRANPWENPLLRTALDELRPGTVELRYVQTDTGLRLGWRDSVLLDTVVGRTRGGDKRTLRDGLRQLRERGMILAGHPLKRYDAVRSDDPALAPWLMDEDGRRLLARLVGGASIQDMPQVAEVHPLVREDPVDDQRHLVRGRKTIEEWLGRAASDPPARLRLLGHLLVARGLISRGETSDPLGLETVPLLERYDPRAANPTRLVSLAAAIRERPRPGLIPAGAVHRGLSRPMLEVGPGVARLLAEVEDFEAGHEHGPEPTLVTPAAAPPSERSTTTPIRRRSRGVPPLLASAVVHPLVIGRLQVAGDASSEGIGLWAKGLRVGELTLPEPLGRVSGRLLLTPLGQKVPQAKVREAVAAQSRTLLADALRQRTLLPPEGPQRRRLDHFVEYMRSVVRVDDRFELAEELGLRPPEDRGKRVELLTKMSLGAAPLRPLRSRAGALERRALLVNVVRQSLAMRVHFDTAMLSWKPVKVGKRRRDGSFEIEFGLRNAWIQRGLDEDRELDDEAHLRAALLAGVFVVAGFFDQVEDELDVGPEHLVVALWRLLRLAS